MPKWYVASSNLVVSPFVNTDQLKSKRLKYSPDSTTALLFFGKNNDIDFINKYFPLYKDWPMICESWLLSPNLKKYLNSNSNILLFQSYFDITNIHENDTSFFEWLFNVNGVIDYDKLNAKTSLQINVKNALINNEKIGSAFGKLNYKKKE